VLCVGVVMQHSVKLQVAVNIICKNITKQVQEVLVPERYPTIFLKINYHQFLIAVIKQN
jgi:hypothetical protein